VAGDVINTDAPRIRVCPVPRPALPDFAGDGLRREIIDVLPIAPSEMVLEINHVYLAVGVAGWDEESEAGLLATVAGGDLPVANEEPATLTLEEGLPGEAEVFR
jgi:hypothetical protein